MPVDLIYHTPESIHGGISPFDAAITEMIEGQALQVACPYVGLQYLQRIAKHARSWQLVTDVEELLSSQAGRSRAGMADFLLQNLERLRHCRDLHAKVILAGDRALVGSANLTEKGITGRIEMAVLLVDCEQVAELGRWFGALWEQTSPVTAADLRSCLASMPQPHPASEAGVLPCKFPRVAARLRALGAPAGGRATEVRLLERMKQAPSREWMDKYFEMVRELLVATGLTNDDPRLVLTIPKGKGLPVTINRRYVLTAFRLEHGHHEKRWLLPDYSAPPGEAVVEMILPASMADIIPQLPKAIRLSAFDPAFAGETAENTPLWVSFGVTSPFSFLPEILDGWRETIVTERDHGRASPYRDHHEPLVYQAVTDLAYRRQLLDEAFSYQSGTDTSAGGNDHDPAPHYP